MPDTTQLFSTYNFWIFFSESSISLRDFIKLITIFRSRLFRDSRFFIITRESGTNGGFLLTSRSLPVIRYSTVTPKASGDHSLELTFQWKRYHGGYVTTTTIKDISFSYTFEAGHHYLITGSFRNDRVHIEVEDLGKNTILFRNGVYTGMSASYGGRFGTGGTSNFMFGPEFGYTFTIDFGTPISVSLLGGGDFGFGPKAEDDPETGEEGMIGFAFGAHGGIFGRFFIPRTDISLGAGYGYRIESTSSTPPYSDFISPYIRGELFWLPVGLYFEYYTNPSYRPFWGGSDDDEPPEDFKILKKWGIGLVLRF